ncbi:MAG: DMT family transporter [Proteobacteria bacterium]|nr:DMT family transporter [Pseudomonadota bacterium]
MTKHHLLEGVICALGAGLAWGLVFIAPLLLADYPPAMLSCGRYLAFGVIAVPLALHDLRGLQAMTRKDWGVAFELALVGNIIYYFCLSASIQLADVPLPTVLIGTLPVVIAIASNWREGTLPWRRLLPSLLVASLGIALVNQAELAYQNSWRAAQDYFLGGVFGVCAVAAWTWYPIRNSQWLKLRPQISAATWATAQGLASMPLAACGLVAAAVWFAAASPGAGNDFPLGPRPGTFIAVMLVLGLVASWLGTVLWNRASRLLPTVLAGQLIVFETLAALTYGFLWRDSLPGADVLAGVFLLVTGVILGVRAFHRGG